MKTRSVAARALGLILTILLVGFSGCTHWQGFTTYIVNETDGAITVHLSFAVLHNGTETFNGTFAIPSGSRSDNILDTTPWEADYLVVARVDGRGARQHVSEWGAGGGCGSCSLGFYVEEDEMSFSQSVAD